MKCKANTGDLIEVTSAFDEPYKIGEILEVEDRLISEKDSEVGVMTTEGYELYDGDYKIFKKKIVLKLETEEEQLRQHLHDTINVMSFEQLATVAKLIGLK